jgi:predicted MFS family arabinose efflux permease
MIAAPRVQRRGIPALVEGCAVQIAGLAALGGAVALNEVAAPTLALLLVIFGIGQAMVLAPLFALILTRVAPAHAGAGAGVVSTVQQIGNASGVAAIGAVYFSVHGTDSAHHAYMACVGILALAVAATACLLAAINRRTPAQTAQAPRAGA